MTTQRETCDAFWDEFCDFVYYPSKGGNTMKAHTAEWIQQRLKYLRTELRAERISYGELLELQSYKDLLHNANRCVDDQSGFRCNRPAVCCPMPGCSVPRTLTDTCLEHMDTRVIDGHEIHMCQECCYEFDQLEVMP